MARSEKDSADLKSFSRKYRKEMLLEAIAIIILSFFSTPVIKALKYAVVECGSPRTTHRPVPAVAEGLSPPRVVRVSGRGVSAVEGCGLKVSFLTNSGATRRGSVEKETEKRIDEMSSDFAKMLKNTLAKMQDRIDFGIQSLSGEGLA